MPIRCFCLDRGDLTFGKTRSQKTRNLFDKRIRCNESIVFARKLFDQLLILVQLFQVIGRHSINAEMFSSI